MTRPAREHPLALFRDKKGVAGPRPKRAHIFERERDEHYVEPEWCSTRLFETESFGPPGARVLDPACGWGRVLRAATDAGYTPVGADLVDRLDRSDLRHVAFSECDFLNHSPVPSVTSVVCNPPFDHIEHFCARGLEIATDKVAMICPLRRLPAARWLERMPLATVYLLTPRPSMPPGKWIAAGNKPGGGTVDFGWLVFDKESKGPPRLRWLHRDGAGKDRSEDVALLAEPPTTEAAS